VYPHSWPPSQKFILVVAFCDGKWSYTQGSMPQLGI
jgi:hypothetical protein